MDLWSSTVTSGSTPATQVSSFPEAAIEAEIQDKALTRPRLTPADIDGQIVEGQYYVFPGTTLTVCCLTLRNGYCVVGQSAAVSPENFDEEIGRKIARAEARDKIWALEGYLLKERLHHERTYTGHVESQQPVEP